MKTLSKSLLKEGLRCQKSLYRLFHKTHKPKEEDSAYIQMGHQVNGLLHSLYPESYVVKSKVNIQKLKETQELLKTEEIIFEATFSYNNVFVMVDMLKRNGDGWDLIEVKSSSGSKSSLKSHMTEYKQDISIQHSVVSKNIKIKNTELWVINNEYVFDGEKYTEDIFKKIPMNDELIEEDTIQDLIKNSLDVLNLKSEPSITIGAQCKKPNDCPFKDDCWKGINKTDLVLIPGLRSKEKLFNEGKISAKDSHFDKKADTIAIKSLRENKPFLNKAVIKKEIEYIQSFKKIHNLDFEGVASAIPLYKNTKPYQTLAFQYSIHVEEGQNLSHRKHLSNGRDNPEISLVKNLIKDLKDAEIIIVYYKTYEIGILKKLAERFPEYSSQLLGFIEKIYDLHPLIKKNVYRRGFNGSYSLKKVSPELLGDQGIWHSDISDGSEAFTEYIRAVISNDEKERASIFEQLDKYCEQDTLVMVNLRKKLWLLAA